MVAILEPDSNDKIPNFFLEKNDISEESSNFQDELLAINPSEPLTDPTIKKKS